MTKVRFSTMVKLNDGKIHYGEEQLPDSLLEQAKPYIKIVAENKPSATASKKPGITPKNSKVAKNKASKRK
jgi:hypothetical protein